MSRKDSRKLIILQVTDDQWRVLRAKRLRGRGSLADVVRRAVHKGIAHPGLRPTTAAAAETRPLPVQLPARLRNDLRALAQRSEVPIELWALGALQLGLDAPSSQGVAGVAKPPHV